jgi:uncharacterized phiE125 gp8 family phage protein
MGRLVLVTAPEAEPLTLDEVKAHLRIDHSADDTLLAGYMAAARLHLEGKDGILGRALMPQTWNLVMDHFPVYWATYCYHHGNPWAIRVPLPPLIDVTSIKYIDPDGVEQTFSDTKYTVDTASEPGRIVLNPGEVWPVTKCIPNAVTVEFECGYAMEDPEAEEDPIVTVPQPIRQALLGLIADFYEHRETEVPTPRWVQALLAPYKVRL